MGTQLCQLEVRDDRLVPHKMLLCTNWRLEKQSGRVFECLKASGREPTPRIPIIFDRKTRRVNSFFPRQHNFGGNLQST